MEEVCCSVEASNSTGNLFAIRRCLLLKTLKELNDIALVLVLDDDLLTLRQSVLAQVDQHLRIASHGQIVLRLPDIEIASSPAKIKLLAITFLKNFGRDSKQDGDFVDGTTHPGIFDNLFRIDVFARLSWATVTRNFFDRRFFCDLFGRFRRLLA